MADLFRTKADFHIVEVNQLSPDNAVALSAWCGGVLVKEHHALQHDITFAAINVPTKDGMKRAQEEDWIVKSLTGQFSVVKVHEFDDILEAVIDV